MMLDILQVAMVNKWLWSTSGYGQRCARHQGRPAITLAVHVPEAAMRRVDASEGQKAAESPPRYRLFPASRSAETVSRARHRDGRAVTRLPRALQSRLTKDARQCRDCRLQAFGDLIQISLRKTRRADNDLRRGSVAANRQINAVFDQRNDRLESHGIVEIAFRNFEGCDARLEPHRCTVKAVPEDEVVGEGIAYDKVDCPRPHHLVEFKPWRETGRQLG
jgi:hypothetical protein